MTSPTDRIIEIAWVLKAQKGDTSAFEALVLRHDARLRYYVRRLADDSAQADDLVQETWLSALRQMPKLREAAAFDVWLFRIARNLCASHVRELQQIRMQNMPAGEVAMIAAPPDSDDGLELLGRDLSTLQRVIEELPLEQREVIALRFVQEMSYEQMAAVLNCPLGTVRSRLHYAKRQLAKALEDARQ